IVIHTVNFSRQFRHDDVWPPIVILILKDHAHDRQPATIFRKRRASFESEFREGSVAIVVKQKLLHSVIRYKNIREAILVVVCKSHTQRPSLLRRDTGALAYIGEGSIAIIVIKNVCRGGKFFRRTIGVVIAAAIFVVLCVPLHIAGNEQIYFS